MFHNRIRRSNNTVQLLMMCLGFQNLLSLIMNFKTCDTCFMGNLSLIDVHVSILVRSRGQRARAGGRGDGRDIWPESGCQ